MHTLGTYLDTHDIPTLPTYTIMLSYKSGSYVGSTHRNTYVRISSGDTERQASKGSTVRTTTHGRRGGRGRRFQRLRGYAVVQTKKREAPMRMISSVTADQEAVQQWKTENDERRHGPQGTTEVVHQWETSSCSRRSSRTAAPTGSAAATVRRPELRRRRNSDDDAALAAAHFRQRRCERRGATTPWRIARPINP
ncbi:hypothetical protein Syun_023126 [Stephania yunnanensis]|uniref:Uncharacterized protein n=1 Tax=Stephania yunnanensis TaxID=152371 RepID=A0AAP0I399_9MAGN